MTCMVDGKSLDAGLSAEPFCRTAGQPDFIVVSALLLAQNLPHQVLPRVPPPIEATVGSGVLQSQDPSLVQRNLARRLALTYLFGQFFVIFAAVFKHDEYYRRAVRYWAKELSWGDQVVVGSTGIRKESLSELSASWTNMPMFVQW